MGVLGEMFPGRKLRRDSGADGDGQPVGERWDIDLDGGVVRLRGRRGRQMRTSVAPATRKTAYPARGRPPEHMFVPLTEQLANVRRWNSDREWGLRAADLDGIDLTPRDHADPLVVDLIAVYLDAEYLGIDLGVMDGVRRTCHEMWGVATERQLNTWCWDWVRDAYRSRPKPVRLLPGIEHRPGVRRVSVDLGAHWSPGRHIRPRDVRGRGSAHAEILAAAAHFPRWARSMDGLSVPHVWLSGYQVTVPEDATETRLPGLAWVHYRRTLSMTVNWADHSHEGWASPVCIG